MIDARPRRSQITFAEARSRLGRTATCVRDHGTGGLISRPGAVDLRLHAHSQLLDGAANRVCTRDDQIGSA